MTIYGELPLPAVRGRASRRCRRSPTTRTRHGDGVDAWIVGVGLAVLGFVCFAVNLIVTLRNMRAPGMAWRRMPLFSWAGER